MLGNFVCRVATELSYIKRSTYMKDATNDSNCTFKLGVRAGIDIPNYVIVGFMQRGPFNQHYQNKDTFY